MSFIQINKLRNQMVNKIGGGNAGSSLYLKIFLFFLILITCFAKSLTKSHYANFYPLNGTFQNYNPVRRLLDGQIPFLDFYDYLGLGHMFSGAIASIFIGDTYQDSLVVFDFLTSLSFCLFSLVIGKCILKKYTTAAVFTILFLFATMRFGNIGAVNYISSLLDPSNSARLIRGMGLAVTAIFFLICVKKWNVISAKFPKLSAESKLTIILGIASGLSVLWSNDYGFSTVGAIILLAMAHFIFTLYDNFSDYRKICVAYLKLIAVFIFSLLISFVFFGEIITYGNLHNWFMITIGIGQYQNWYYNSAPNYYIYNLELSSSTVLQLLLSIYYIVKWLNRE